MGRTFPHRITGIDALHSTPFLNDVVADFAMRAVDAEGLGRDTVPDLLGLSFSASDGVGHTFGPESHEVMDATVRLDRTLQRLFGFLDQTVGLANVVMVLTADHGVAPMPEVLARIRPGSTARRLDPAIIEVAVRKALAARYGQVDAPGWVVYHVPPQMYLNRAALAALNIPVEDAERVAQAAVQAVPGVHEVLTGSKLTRQRAAGVESGPVRSFHPSRSGNLYYMLEPYWLADASASGAEHGSGWGYDQEVRCSGSAAVFCPVCTRAPLTSRTSRRRCPRCSGCSRRGVAGPGTPRDVALDFARCPDPVRRRHAAR